MSQQVELSSLDLRYEGYRMKSKEIEAKLLESILSQGIRDPLVGVDSPDGRLLLNGFKRYRCAVKLGIGTVPWCSLSKETPIGIIEFLRISTSKTLTILEQARLISELKTIHNMCQSEIALYLEKSRAWVSVRANLFKEMPGYVADAIFNGGFPAYSYMYTLRKFMRINSVTKKEVEKFVRSVAGKNLSLREVDTLAQGYFRGSEELRDQIRSGKLSFSLTQLKPQHDGPICTKPEQDMVKALEITKRHIEKVACNCSDTRLNTSSFKAQANLLTASILNHLPTFKSAVKELHDRTGQA